ncbi:MAG: hypothetical protein R3D27_11690 [Hyphomicrobiaceae bacterium]
MGASATPAAGARLPELRQDLRIVGDAVDLSGQRYWKIYDPLSHRYTALSRKHIAMLDAWPAASGPEAIVEAAWQTHTEIVTPAEVADFAAFLVANGLAGPAEAGGWRRQFEETERRRAAHLTRLVKGYLFFKLPLVNPERFLRATLPIVRPLASRASVVVLLAILLLDVALVLREWDQFVSSALRLASWSGALGMLPAIVLVKLLHELAHGYVATHFGCRVRSLGVAFVVGAPLLFVDVTDSWKIRSRRIHLMIGGAGIGMDLAVSIVATLAWVFLPDGGARGIAFNLATVGWATSLTMNLNPFMRFDGYHLLADAVGMPNMQTRAMALSRWRVRETLFGLGAPPPEVFPTTIATLLALYGYAVWVYRVTLFVAIALVVYAHFFKVLGIILFLVEIIYFIVGPLLREMREWHRMRRRILATGRTRLTVLVGAAALALALVPWPSTVRIPAVLEPVGLAEVHIPVPARLLEVATQSGASVAAGAPLFKFDSRALGHELETTRLRASVVDLRLSRLMSEARDREQAVVLRQERAALERAISGIRKRIAELSITAPISGIVARIADYPAVGRWATPSEPLVLIHGAGRRRIRGLVDAEGKARIRAGMKAWFIPGNPLAARVPGTVSAISSVNIATIDQIGLAQSFGGGIPSVLNSRREAIPVAPHYQVLTEIDGSESGPAGNQGAIEVGILHVQGDPQSVLVRVWRRVLMVMVRESGF